MIHGELNHDFYYREFPMNAKEVDKFLFFFFNDTATTEIYTLSLHDALPIRVSAGRRSSAVSSSALPAPGSSPTQKSPVETSTSATPTAEDVAWAASRKLLRAPSRN